MTWPKISIITPSFNQGDFLEETIQSVISQNYPNLEYIVIDGGSTDNSVEIIKKFEHHLHYWVSEKDSGQSEAINKGIRKASGDLTAWLNSDDIYLSGALHKAANCFLQNPEADLIYGKVENMYPDKSRKIIDPPAFDPATFLERVSIHQPGVFWKRKLHDRIGWLDESLHYLMDYDLWMRVFFNYNCLKVDETFSRFRIHPNSKTGTNPPELYAEYRKVVSVFFNSFDRNDLVKELQLLDVYENPENKKIQLTRVLHQDQLKKLIKVYVHQCAIQDYSFGQVNHANKLFMASLHPQVLLRTLVFLIKNNLRVRHITSLYR